MSLQAGKLNKRVIIQVNSPSQNSLGEMIPSWSTHDTIWAAVEPLVGTELVKAQQIDPEATVKITIRYRVDPNTNVVDVTPANRILWGTRIYEINAVIDPTEKHEELNLLSKEIL